MCGPDLTALQSQMAASAHFTSEQILPFGFADQTITAHYLMVVVCYMSVVWGEGGCIPRVTINKPHPSLQMPLLLSQAGHV